MTRCSESPFDPTQCSVPDEPTVTSGSAHRRHWLGAVGGLLAAPLVSPLAAADFPVRALRMVSPYSPGGVADPVARALAESLSKDLGHATRKRLPTSLGAVGEQPICADGRNRNGRYASKPHVY